MKKCPLCGQTTLLEKCGEYRMQVPSALGGSEIIVTDTAWIHCESCGEDILSSDLEHEINRQCSDRRVSKVG